MPRRPHPAQHRAARDVTRRCRSSRTAITPPCRPVTSITSPCRRSPPQRPQPAHLHDESNPTAPHRTEACRPRSTPGFFPSRPRRGPSAVGRREDIFPPSNRLPAHIKGPAWLPTLPRTATAESPCFPELPTTTTATTIVGRRPTPRSRLHEPSLTKVREGIDSPRPPLHFPPIPGRCRPRGAANCRRPGPPASLPCS
jgi:hypothetical protein